MFAQTLLRMQPPSSAAKSAVMTATKSIDVAHSKVMQHMTELGLAYRNANGILRDVAHKLERADEARSQHNATIYKYVHYRPSTGLS